MLVLRVGNEGEKKVLTLLCAWNLVSHHLFLSVSQMFPNMFFYPVSPTDHLAALEGDIIAADKKFPKLDPHAKDKAKLAASHKGKELPIDNPAKYEGTNITSDKLQKDAAKDLREEAQTASENLVSPSPRLINLPFNRLLPLLPLNSLPRLPLLPLRK